MKKYICMICGILAMAACDKAYVYDGPDGVDSRLYEFGVKAAKTKVLVYSGGSRWTVRLIDEPSWARVADIDGGDSRGAGCFTFECDANTSVARETRAVVYFHEKRDTILMRQSGVEITFSFDTQSFVVPAEGGTQTVAVTTNLPAEQMDRIAVQVDYDSPYDRWIDNISIMDGVLTFDCSRAVVAGGRTAVLRFRYYDVTGNKLIDYPLNVTQK